MNGHSDSDSPTICDVNCFYPLGHDGPHQRWLGAECDVPGCVEMAQYQRKTTHWAVCLKHLSYEGEFGNDKPLAVDPAVRDVIAKLEEVGSSLGDAYRATRSLRHASRNEPLPADVWDEILTVAKTLRTIAKGDLDEIIKMAGQERDRP